MAYMSCPSKEKFKIDEKLDSLVSNIPISPEIELSIIKAKTRSITKTPKKGGKKIFIWGAGNLGFSILLDSLLQNSLMDSSIDIKMVLPRLSENIAKRLAPVYKHNGTVIKNILTKEEFFIELKPEQFIPAWDKNKFKEAINDSEIIIIAMPDIPKARKAIFGELELFTEKTVIFMPGGEGGIIESARKVFENKIDTTIGFLETSPYGSRMGGFLNFKRKNQVDISAFPVSKTEQVKKILEETFPLINEKNKHIMSFNKTTPINIILGGRNYIFHSAVVLDPENLLKSIGTVYPDSLYSNKNQETNRFSYNHYLEGVTEENALVMEKLDEERIAIAKAYGIKSEPINKLLDTHYGIGNYSNYYDAFRACKNVYDSRPPCVDELASHRYILEDLPGMAVIERLGMVVGVETPVTSKLFQVLKWNANAIGVKEEDIQGYKEALDELPSEKDELVSYLTNPLNFLVKNCSKNVFKPQKAGRILFKPIIV